MRLGLTEPFLAAALLMLCGTFSGEGARAGIITSLGITSFPPASTGIIGPVGNTPEPNNDNATTASPNTIPYNIFFNSLGNLDVEFVVTNSGGITEYRLPQVLINNTGQVWTGFRFELGFGTGENFVRSTISDFLDFDTPELDPTPTSSVFSLLNPQADFLDWAGGTVPAISVVTFNFAIDVPDNLQDFNPSGLNRFTLRQIPTISPPTVPEPSSLGLLGAALASLSIKSRKRRRARPQY